MVPMGKNHMNEKNHQTINFHEKFAMPFYIFGTTTSFDEMHTVRPL